MSDDRDLLLTRSLDDPELQAHLANDPDARRDAEHLRVTLDAFHAELQRAPEFTLPPQRNWRTTMSTMLLVAATLSVITLTSVQTFAPTVESGSTTEAVYTPDLTLVEKAEKHRWNQLDEREWLTLAKDLEGEAKRVVERRPDTVDGLRVLVQTGRSAEYASLPAPPFFEQLPSGRGVNVYYLEAARVVHRKPSLRTADLGEGFDVVREYVLLIEQGTLR